MTLYGFMAGELLAFLTAAGLAWKWQLGVPRIGAAVILLGIAAGGLEAALFTHVRYSLEAQIGLHWGTTIAAGLVCLGGMFYRDPPRVAPVVAGGVLSPADGVVVYVREARGGVLPVATKKGRNYSLGELTGSPLQGSDAVVVGISMSLLDVHVNRVPVSGRIAFCGHFPGAFGSLRRTEMLFANERATTVIEKDGLAVAVVQIASRLVRRIALFIKAGQSVEAGQKLGAIRMGSQVDVVLPRREGLTVTVREGERLRAGESVIAILPPASRRRAGSAPRVPPAGAIVVGGDYRGLCIARSLGRHGVPVWVLAGKGELLAASSRYVRRVERLPDAGNAGLVPTLEALGERFDLGGWALIPTSDEAAAAIAGQESRLSRFTLTTPRWDVMRWAYDKRLTHALARYAGVEIPRTWYPSDRSQLLDMSLPYPVILKPAVKDRQNALTRDRAWQVDTLSALVRRYDRACRLMPAELVMVQELIPGGGEAQVSYAALWDSGAPVASLTARRHRQYPPRFGHSSSLVETVDLPEVAQIAERLLAAVGYTGLVEVEFKFDRREGTYKLLDINPRAWTWLVLGAGAGIDFPWLLWQQIQGRSIPRQAPRPGVRWVRLSADALSAASQVLRGELTLPAWARSLRGPLHLSHFAKDDPLPALAALPSGLITRVSRVVSRLRGARR